VHQLRRRLVLSTAPRRTQRRPHPAFPRVRCCLQLLDPQQSLLCAVTPPTHLCVQSHNKSVASHLLDGYYRLLACMYVIHCDHVTQRICMHGFTRVLVVLEQTDQSVPYFAGWSMFEPYGAPVAGANKNSVSCPTCGWGYSITEDNNLWSVTPQPRQITRHCQLLLMVAVGVVPTLKLVLYLSIYLSIYLFCLTI
jgi:hypothetical protein